MKAKPHASRDKQMSRLSARWLPSLSLATLVLLLLYVGDTGWRMRDDPAHDSSLDRTAVVIADVLNLRTKPSRSAAVISTAVEGQTVQITGGAVGDFLPVVSGLEQGWMASAFLAPITPSVAGTSPIGTEDSSSQNLVSEERWIEIDRSDTTVSLHDGEVEVAVFTGRIGRDPASDGFYSTATGTYHVYSLNKGLAPTPFAEDTWLTDWVGFDPERKNGIHSPVRESDGTVREWQNPTTLGCVRLDEQAAVTVFEFAKLGMRVEVVE